LATVEMLGLPVELALTFIIGPDGRPYDPATEDGELPIQ
jgi:hypothetical protein